MEYKFFTNGLYGELSYYDDYYGITNFYYLDLVDLNNYSNWAISNLVPQQPSLADYDLIENPEITFYNEYYMGQSYVGTLSDGGGGVPEPATVVGLAIAALALLRRRPCRV